MNMEGNIKAVCKLGFLSLLFFFHGSATGDKSVRSLSSFAFLAVGNPVFILLHLVLKLGKLLLAGGSVGFQFG